VNRSTTMMSVIVSVFMVSMMSVSIRCIRERKLFLLIK
jgi:hypothetical protein